MRALIITVIIMSVLLATLAFLDLFKPTGFAVYKEVEIGQDIEDELNEKGEARVIVELEADEDIEDLDEVSEIKEKLKAGKIKKDKFNRLKDNKNIKKVYFDKIFTIHLQDSVPLINAAKVQSLQINKINITGKDGICILDTGIDYRHGDLGNCANISSCNRVVGYDFVNKDNDPLDDNGHGTHVAGIAAANGIIKGVAPDAKIIAMKVCDSLGRCYLSDILSAIDWCAKNKELYKISSISMSFGGGLYTDYCDSDISILSNSIDSAVKKNITLVASSGNSGSTTQIAAPACIRNVISVASTTKQDTISSFSNINSIIDLLAPGSDINSTAINNNYVKMSGTSMATPHVSGAIALLQQYKKEESNTELTPSKIENILKNNGKSIIYNAFNLTRIDVYKALIALDSKKPDITLNITPAEIEFNNGNVSINFIIEDTNLNNYNLTVYYPNNTILNTYTNNVILTKDNLTEKGNYIITVYADDFNKNFNTLSSGLLVKNISLPIVTLNTKNNYTSTTNNITLSCSVISDYALANISLYHNINNDFSFNQTIDLTNLSVNSYTTNFTLNNLQNNLSFIWNCLAYNINDYSAFAQKNNTFNIKLDHTPLIISFNPNSPVTINENEIIIFNQTSTDPDNNVLIYGWFLDSVQKADTQNYTYITDSNSIGVHNITLTVSDGLLATSQYWNVTVNQLPQQSTPSSGGGGGGGGGGSSTEQVNELKITTEAAKEVNKPLTKEAEPQASTPIITVPEEPQRLTGYAIFGNIFGNLRYNLLTLILLLSLLTYLYRREIRRFLKRI